MAAPKLVNWSLALKDYLEDSTMTYKKIAEKYGVSPKTVEQRASDEGWVESRKSLGKKVVLAAEGEIVDRNGKINEKHITQYTDMQVLSINMIRIASNTVMRAAKAKGIENLTPYEKDFLSAKAIKDLFDAAKVAMDGERVINGLPTSVERKEVTGKDGSDLFAKVDTDKLYDLMEDTVKALAEAERSGKHGAGDSPSTGTQQD